MSRPEREKWEKRPNTIENRLDNEKKIGEIVLREKKEFMFNFWFLKNSEMTIFNEKIMGFE